MLSAIYDMQNINIAANKYHDSCVCMVRESLITPTHGGGWWMADGVAHSLVPTQVNTVSFGNTVASVSTVRCCYFGSTTSILRAM